MTTVSFRPEKTHYADMTTSVFCSRRCRWLSSRKSVQLTRCCGRSFANSLLTIVCSFSFLTQLQQCLCQDTVANARQLAKTLSAATVRIETATDVSSGVIVSETGLILSVAHGLTPTDRTVTVFLHDGRPVKATVQFRNPDSDVAVVQVIDAAGSRLPPPIPVQIRVSAPPHNKRRPIVFACGFPARESSGQSPVLRMGRIEAQDRNAIRSSCVLTAGDSGGPLVNANGQLIGLHRRIGLRREVNVHIPTTVIRAAISGHVDLPKTGSRLSSPVHIAATPSARVLSKLQTRTVGFYSADENRPFLHGTLLTPSLVATKLSELPADLAKPTCGHSPESAVGFSRIAMDRQLDVLLVRLHQSLVADVSSLVLPTDAATSLQLAVGQIVFSGVNAAGVVARTHHREENITPRLGLALIIQAGNIVVEKVTPLTAASAARLQPGDQLTKLADTVLRNLDDVASAISQFQPGDHVVFDIERNRRQLTRHGQLTFPADSLLQRTDFLDGRAGELSRRRTGFAGVIQHDGNLTPSQMGGPLVDVHGNCLGVNIARCGRESVLAVPVDRIFPLLKTQTQ
ncbi:MAG: trypsin-like peptidase domain-containing protein [Fuerstiella sp.]|nr:trypsin-like peptidase domain-containing protein [Fuerstiella sp.]